jgi:hypothetical protein
MNVETLSLYSLDCLFRVAAVDILHPETQEPIVRVMDKIYPWVRDALIAEGADTVIVFA